MDWFFDRIKEPSTINAVIGIAGLVGVNVSPELQEPIVYALGGAACIYNFIRKEN